LAHAFLREYSDKRLKLAQLLGQLGEERLLSQVLSYFAAVLPVPAVREDGDALRGALAQLVDGGVVRLEALDRAWSI
jgi:hypothetical protein